jgi:hypothetical protein
VTPSTALSLFSTRAAHDAHVIPTIESSSLRGADDASPVTAADDTCLIPPSSTNPASHSGFRHTRRSRHARLDLRLVEHQPGYLATMPGNLHQESKAKFNVAKM